MKKNFKNVESISLPYEKPEVAFVEIKTEGILCASAEHEDEYNELKFVW